MSLILEALRKSEAERRRGQVPDVAAELPPTPLAHARRTPAWLWPVAAIGTLIVALLLWWSLRDAPAPMQPVASPQRSEAEAEAAPPVLVARPRPATPAIAPSPTPVRSQRAPEPLPPAAAAIASPQPQTPQTAIAPAPSAPAPSAPASTLPAPDNIPTTTSSRAELTMHVWDESAARRFVILDGQRMGEGDRNGALQVIAIERDSVVIERNGRRSRLRLP